MAAAVLSSTGKNGGEGNRAALHAQKEQAGGYLHELRRVESACSGSAPRQTKHAQLKIFR
jgi:hypothetical protein